MTSLRDPRTDQKVLAHLVRFLQHVLYTPLSSRARTWSTLLAAALFVVVAVVSIRAIGGIDPDPRFLLLGAFLTPLLQLANAAEYQRLGKLLEQEVKGWEALEITTLATAANLLPVPGGVLVRIREMSGRSGSLSRTTVGTVLVGLLWLAAASAFAFLGFLVLDRTISAVAFAGLTGLLVTVAAVLGHRMQTCSVGDFIVLASIELALCFTASFRILAVMAGIGVAPSLPLAVIFATSGPLAFLLGFFPGGLGLQELIAAGLASLAAVAPEIGAATVAADRLVGYAALAVGAGLLWLRARAERGSGTATGSMQD